MAKSDDWYTSSKWDPAERDEFFARLTRARGKSLYYARAKAWALKATGRKGTRAAIELLTTASENWPADPLYGSVQLAIAKFSDELGDPLLAAKHFSAAIDYNKAARPSS